jgi:hypothetical protein
MEEIMGATAMPIGLRFLWSLILVVGLSVPALAENRLAFVVGINAYPHLPADAQLQRAVTDAGSVADALTRLGFRVTRMTEATSLDDILGGFDRFTHAIEPGDTVLFYYAGHGISLDDGNYLIPADVPALGPTDERIAKRHAIAERDIKQSLRAAGARVAIVVLDACRNNPFPARGTRAIGGGTRGLARIEATDGVYSLYSAREGQSALDRLSDTDPDRNSVFTRVFLKALETPGVNLSELGDIVRDDVAALARRANQEQVPAVSNDMIGARTVYLAGPPSAAAAAAALPPPPVPPPAPPAPAPDDIAWSFIATTTDARQLDTFLARFPQSPHRAEAEARLADLGRATMAALPPPAPPAEPAVAQQAPPDPSIADCDNRMALAFDALRPAGIPGHSMNDFHDMDGAKAEPVCRAALAARPGDPRLQLELALALAISDKGAKEPGRGEIIELLQTSVAGGDKAAAAMLAVADIELRRDEPGKVEEGIALLRRAADGGLGIADFILGDLYERGRSVTADLAEARTWYAKGAAAGSPEATAALDRLDKVAEAPSAPPTPPAPATAARALPAPAAAVRSVTELVGHAGEVRNLAVSPDGTKLASVSVDRSVRLWDLSTGTEIRQWFSNDLYVAFSPDGRRIAFGTQASDGHETDVADVASGAVLFRLPMENIMAAAFSPDGRQLATGGFGEDNAIAIWDLDRGTRVRTIKFNRNTVQTLDYARDGRRLLSSSSDNSVRVFDPATGVQKVKIQLPVGVGGVNSATFSADGETIVAGSWSAKLRTWNASTGRLLKEWLTQREAKLTVAAVSPDGSVIASASAPGVIQLWQTKTAKPLGEIKGFADTADAVVFAPDGSWIAFDGGEDHVIHIRPLPQAGLAGR